VGRLSLVLGVCIGFLVSGAVYADDHNQVKQLLDEGEIISAESLLVDAMKRKPGRLLELELEVENGRRVYEVEIIDDAGVVWEFYYDAKTGAFISQAIED
jgi:uncharacterized membrane protein YkoI